MANNLMQSRDVEKDTTMPKKDSPAPKQGTPTSKQPHTPSEQHSKDTKSTAKVSEGAPFGQQTEGTQSAAKVVEEVVHSVKAAVDGAIAWAEKKVDDLSSELEAMCVPSDLDPIVGGLGAAAMPTQNVDGMDQSVHAQEDEDEKEKKKAKDENGDDERKKR
jgi:hypothetical protein